MKEATGYKKKVQQGHVIQRHDLTHKTIAEKCKADKAYAYYQRKRDRYCGKPFNAVSADCARMASLA